MSYKEGDIIKLDNNKEYIVISNIECNKDSYLYLMTVGKPLNMLLVKVEEVKGKEKLINITDVEEKKYILSMFLNKVF